MKRLKDFLSENIFVIILFLGILGFIDASYLTYERYNSSSGGIVCNYGIFSDCGRVLKSRYSEIYGIPLSALGIVQYATIVLTSLYVLITKKRIGKYLLLILTAVGVIASTYFVYLQIFVIGSLCLYCMISALISLTLFLFAYIFLKDERVRLFSYSTRLLYKIFRPLIFLTNSDWIHGIAVSFGGFLGNSGIAKLLGFFFRYENVSLEQNILGIKFNNPVGLAAGFDYDAKLTKTLPFLGFGYQTVGTVTNMPYKGNSPPMLGRLPKSKSLMVNKGFKSSGAKSVINNLKGLEFDFPLGVSVGKTNSMKLKTQKRGVDDIVKTFKAFEKSNVKHSYYELNISCPNLKGDINFYSPKNLEKLLVGVDKLKLKKPVFVKMPIEKSDKEVLGILKVISKYSPKGVIFGNLQKNRKHPSFVLEEVAKFDKGNFSGKPTFLRSNELIGLTYKHYKGRFVIVGCGGIFNGKDAYKKIRLGATLLQFITGMIYEGPQAAANINSELSDLLKGDGYKKVKDAVGVDVK